MSSPLSSSEDLLVQEQAGAFMRFVDKSFCGHFLQSLSGLRHDHQYTDVTLKSDGVLLPCHRIVLSAASPYFHAMFTSGLEESGSSTVEIKRTDHSTLQSIVEYVYSAEILITDQNVQNLVQASDEFQFDELKEACEKFMLQQIEPSNCIGFYQFGKLFRMELLKAGARSTMMTCFKSVVCFGEFKELSEMDLIEYISDSNISVLNEDAVFDAVMRWLNVNPQERQPAFERVLAHVRLPYCTSAYLCHVVKNHQLFSAHACQEYLEEARMFHMLPDRRHEITSQRTIPRKDFSTNRRLVLLGGLTKEDKDNRYCWYFQEDEMTWDRLATLPLPNWKFYNACVTQSGILLTGGHHINIRKYCWLFDVAEKKWKVMPNMRDARCKHRSVVHCGQVYVIGGEDNQSQPMAAVEYLDSSTRIWNRVTPMKKELTDPLAASFGHCIYVFGGIKADGATITMTQRYDTVSGEWSVMAEMPKLCLVGAAAAFNDRIFIVGGYTRICMCYDPGLDSWTVLTAPRKTHGNAPVVVWNGRILVGGGDAEGNEVSSVVEEYDPQNDEWSYSTVALKEKLSCHHLLNVDMPGL